MTPIVVLSAWVRTPGKTRLRFSANIAIQGAASLGLVSPSPICASGVRGRPQASVGVSVWAGALIGERMMQSDLYPIFTLPLPAGDPFCFTAAARPKAQKLLRSERNNSLRVYGGQEAAALFVPAGALAANTPVKVTATELVSGEAFPPAVRAAPATLQLEPDAHSFIASATFRFDYTPDTFPALATAIAASSYYTSALTLPAVCDLEGVVVVVSHTT